MNEIVFIKLGGSVITKPEPYTADYDVIKSVLTEIKEIKEKRHINILIGHGGGSFPHIPAHEYRVSEGIINEKSLYGRLPFKKDLML